MEFIDPQHLLLVYNITFLSVLVSDLWHFLYLKSILAAILAAILNVVRLTQFILIPLDSLTPQTYS